LPVRDITYYGADQPGGAPVVRGASGLCRCGLKIKQPFP